MPNPKRGEIWFVEFDPTRGSELNKTRRAVVISSDSLGILKVKLVVPLTEWDEKYRNYVWHVRVDPTPQNHLKKSSSADTLQTRAVSYERFQQRGGVIDAVTLEEIVAALAVVTEYS
jgi:mRNA interferase MazF